MFLSPPSPAQNSNIIKTFVTIDFRRYQAESGDKYEEQIALKLLLLL